MFDNTLIKNELSGLVGFRQPANPKHAIIAGDNLNSLSDLYVTDNPYVKVEYLIANVDYNRMTAAQFNDVLKRMREASAINICTQVFAEDDFIDRNTIYGNTQNKNKTSILPQGFIGYAIEIDEQKSVGFRINRAIIEMATSGSIDLLVFNSNIKQPIYTQTINYDEFYHLESIDLPINNIGYYRGTFYVGFISDGTISTYDRNYNNSNVKNSLKNLCIENAFVSGVTTPEIFNLDEVHDITTYCGLNLDITVLDDFSDFITTNKYLFSRAIYLDCIIACLNIYAASLRSNGDERNAEELYSRIMLEIEGTRPDDNVITIRGLRPQVIYEISQIREQIKKLKGGFFGKGYDVLTQD